MWEDISGVLVAHCFLHGSWHKVVKVACWGSICFCLGTAFLLLSVTITTLLGSGFVMKMRSVFVYNCKFFSLSKSSGFSNFLFYPWYWYKHPVICEGRGDLLNLSIAKKYLFSSECAFLIDDF